MSGRLLAAAIVIAALGVLGPSDALAQPVPSSRVWGLGGGFGIGTERTSVNTEHTFVQPVNLELRIAVAERLELAAHVPVMSIVYATSLNGNHDRFLWFDLFAVWYPLRESGGLFVAPGIGMIYGSTKASSGAAVEVPARIGWETSRRGFGKAFSVRPFIDVVFPSGNVDVGTRYGVLFELTLIGYSTRATQANK